MSRLKGSNDAAGGDRDHRAPDLLPPVRDQEAKLPGKRAGARNSLRKSQNRTLPNGGGKQDQFRGKVIREREKGHDQNGAPFEKERLVVDVAWVGVLVAVFGGLIGLLALLL